MDIAGMSVMMSQSKVQQQAGLAVTKMAMNVTKEKGDAVVDLITKSMEQSVQPNLGQNIDNKA